MKYKVGDRVRIKSIDWYNENKDEDGDVFCVKSDFVSSMSVFCGKILTIDTYLKDEAYLMKEDKHSFVFTDEMIEGLVEEVGLVDKLSSRWVNEFNLPDGYIFKDENGNVINTQKIVLEKKENRYPKTYKECCKVLGIEARDFDVLYNMLDTSEKNYCNNLDRLLNTFRKLLICRDAYWKIAGEEMELGKPWKPDWKDNYQKKWTINFYQDEINLTNGTNVHFVLAFPTEEMRNAFYENFKELINECKELL